MTALCTVPGAPVRATSTVSFEISVVNPLQSTSLGNLPVAITDVGGLAVLDGTLYLVNTDDDDLYRIDDPTAPGSAVLVGSLPTDLTNPVGLTAYDGDLFVADRGNVNDEALWRIDASAPSSTAGDYGRVGLSRRRPERSPTGVASEITQTRVEQINTLKTVGGIPTWQTGEQERRNFATQDGAGNGAEPTITFSKADGWDMEFRGNAAPRAVTVAVIDRSGEPLAVQTIPMDAEVAAEDDPDALTDGEASFTADIDTWTSRRARARARASARSTHRPPRAHASGSGRRSSSAGCCATLASSRFGWTRSPTRPT